VSATAIVPLIGNQEIRHKEWTSPDIICADCVKPRRQVCKSGGCGSKLCIVVYKRTEVEMGQTNVMSNMPAGVQAAVEDFIISVVYSQRR